jgi:orotate phosphoribosyltransferase
MSDKLAAMVRKYALELAPEGKPFVLKSGATSPYYLDCRNLTLTPEGLHCIVTDLMASLRGVDFDAVGGPCVGADPIVGGAVFMAALFPRGRVKGFLVRPEAKDHGKGGRIVGPLAPGDKCVVVEDVTTSGGSAMSAVEAVEAFGAKVVRVVAVVDRQQGGRELFEAKGIPFHPLLTVAELGPA